MFINLEYCCLQEGAGYVHVSQAYVQLKDSDWSIKGRYCDGKACVVGEGKWVNVNDGTNVILNHSVVACWDNVTELQTYDGID